MLFVAILLLANLASCGEKQEAGRIADQVKVLATVNGVPLTEYDLKQISRQKGDDNESLSPEETTKVLETLVHDELISQKAIELELDKDPGYLKKLSAIESQLRSFKRREMSALYRRHVQKKAEVTDAEAQEYFDKNAKNIQTKFHVLQIFWKDNYAEIVKDHQDLKKGVPFEKVAARRFTNLPEHMKTPWDRGSISRDQMPPAWVGIVDLLEPGQMTDIIKGDGNRFWVIKLVDKNIDPQITFMTEKAKIIEILRQQKADALYNNMLAEMKANAKIDYKK